MIHQIVGGKYQIKQKLGSGSFGEIYIAEDLKLQKEVAIKINTPKDHSCQLQNESTIYSILSGATNIPDVYWFGSFGKNIAMSMELLGKSIQDRFNQCNMKFSLKTVLLLADQMLSAVEYIHTRHFIHRDLKPNNFVFGTNSKSNQLYLIDFGLSRKFRDSKTLEHCPYSKYKELIGTARYSSINALNGIEQSRRDDMESLAYMWIYFLKGSLPWIGIPAKDAKRKNLAILHMKSNISIDSLCDGLPEEFAQYLTAVRKLKYSQAPDYANYREMFRNLFITKGYIYDYVYDWNEKKSKIAVQSKKQSVQFSKSADYLKKIDNQGIKHNENDPSNSMTKKVPIIHNRRLVPNYENENLPGKMFLIKLQPNQSKLSKTKK